MKTLDERADEVLMQRYNLSELEIMRQTTEYQGIKLHLAGKDLLYHFCKEVGLIWLVKRIPFLELKNWVKEYEKKSTSGQ